MVILIPVCSVALYRHLARKHDVAALWRSSVMIGCCVGIVRGVLASFGCYTVEHTSGPLQIPAFALAMLAWPEAAMLGRLRGPTPMSFFPTLAILLMVTTILLVSCVALTAQVSHGRCDAQEPLQPTPKGQRG
jgi:hypothetical protein